MSVDEMEGVVQDPSEDFKTNFLLLERAVAQFDSRFTLRALRSISSLRKKLAETKIAQLDVKRPIKDLLPEVEKELTGEAKKESVPEIRIYIAVLIQVHLYFTTPIRSS
jgi:26S proteasome regulatory subunit N3